MTPGEIAFSTAREAVSRRAFTQFKQQHGVDPKDRAAVSGAYAEFCRLQLLSDPHLRAFAVEVLEESSGALLTGNEPFPAVLWMHGATRTHGGRAFKGTLHQFSNLLLHERAKVVAPKRSGWVLEPVTNPEGRRTNECTLAVHALFLDCDGAGEWEGLLGALGDLDLFHIAYQSGGWTPATPKWRVVLPLAKPFDTSTPELQERWKAAYNAARVLFGALGDLTGHGFDPATETPCCPWFLTEKREAGDPERIITGQRGRALDLETLLSLVPAPPAVNHDEREYAAVAPLLIDAVKFEEIVDALSAATAHVPSGRRDIYMAMPAVLLQRGICPDDTRRIVEEVSLRYPRIHKEKHADNMHCAETTIGKWESEGAAARITQIGTLQSLAPEVAAAFDEVLPDLARQAMADAIKEQLGEMVSSLAAAPVMTATSPAPVVYSSEPTVSKVPAKPAKRPKMTAAEKKMSTAAKRLRKHKNTDRQIEGLLMLSVLQRLPLPAKTSDELTKLVLKLARAIGYQMADITWTEAMELMSPTLLVTDFTQSATKVQAAEKAFYEGRGARGRAKAKKEKKKLAEREKLAVQTRKLA